MGVDLNEIADVLGIPKSKDPNKIIQKIRETYGRFAAKIAERYYRFGDLKKALDGLKYKINRRTKLETVSSRASTAFGALLGTIGPGAVVAGILGYDPTLATMAGLLGTTAWGAYYAGASKTKNIQNKVKREIVGAMAVISALELYCKNREKARRNVEAFRRILQQPDLLENVDETLPDILTYMAEKGIQFEGLSLTLGLDDVRKMLIKRGWVTGESFGLGIIPEAVQDLEELGKNIQEFLDRAYIRAGDHPSLPEDARKLVRILNIHKLKLPADAPMNELGTRILKHIAKKYGALSAAYVALKKGEALGLNEDTRRELVGRALDYFNVLYDASAAYKPAWNKLQKEYLKLGRVAEALNKGVNIKEVPRCAWTRRSKSALKELKNWRKKIREEQKPL